MKATVVRFTDLDEYVGELKRDRHRIDRSIVRVTRQWRPSRAAGAIRHVSVVSTALVGDHLVRFERYFGDDWGPAFEGDDRRSMLERVDDTVKHIEGFCQTHGLDARAGVFEVDEAA